MRKNSSLFVLQNYSFINKQCYFFPSRTIMKQEAVVTVFGLSFSSYCEKLITETYENNSTKVSFGRSNALV